MAGLRLPLLRTPPHPCSYLPGQQAQTLFADPAFGFSDGLYQQLLEQGFRRSGEHIYRPQCPNCSACQSLRLPVAQWRPRRSQRRIWNRVAAALEVRALAPIFDPQHFDLYRRYIDQRHAEGDMANPSPQAYLQFLTSPWCTSRFVEFRLHQRLLAIAVTDYLSAGLSAVYSFYDPDQEHLSPGVISILWQIQEARRLGLPYLYLGYWIKNCRKMAYKTQYRPHQIFQQGRWRDQPESQHAEFHYE
ncbi:MAG: arginyltransferase [Gammaproteobacteria bacterium]|nr:arginyltransferase [Gammaproteobacteria bacterium]